MIVKNESRFLTDALRSVKDIVDELCIVDTGSTDETMAIAESFGANVKRVGWRDDFAWARNEALSMASRSWILVLDADERLVESSRDGLCAIGASPAGLRGKWIQCRNLADDVKGSGATTNAIVRIFPNNPRIRYRNPIHEFVTLDGAEGGLPSDRTDIEIVHYGYLSDVVRDREKGERNLRLSRAAVEREPDDAFHHFNLAMALLMGTDKEGAIGAFERVREMTRETPVGFRAQALAVLADLYREGANGSADALKVITECLAVAPNFSTAHFTHGRILADSGDLHGARDAFGKAIAAGAHDSEQFVVDNEVAIWKAHSEIGSTLMREERYAEALKWFDLASAQRPMAETLVLNRARCHEKLGDVVAAGTLYAGAFEAYRDEQSAIDWVNFLLRSGREAEALVAIEASLDRVGDGYFIVFLGMAAVIYMRTGREAQAKAAIARALGAGDPREVGPTLRALAEQLQAPELTALLTEVSPKRASGLRIAYNPDL